MSEELKEYLKGSPPLYNDIMNIMDSEIINGIVNMDTKYKKLRWVCSSFKGNPKELKQFIDQLIK